MISKKSFPTGTRYRRIRAFSGLVIRIVTEEGFGGQDIYFSASTNRLFF